MQVLRLLLSGMAIYTVNLPSGLPVALDRGEYFSIVI